MAIYNRLKKLTDPVYAEVNPSEVNARGDIDGAIQEVYDALNSTSGADYVSIGTTTVKSKIETLETDKLAKNTTIVAGTKAKITYDAKGLVLSGADLTESDLPSTVVTDSDTISAITGTTGKLPTEAAVVNYTIPKTAIINEITEMSRTDKLITEAAVVSYSIPKTDIINEITGTTGKLPTEAAVVNYTIPKTAIINEITEMSRTDKVITEKAFNDKQLQIGAGDMLKAVYDPTNKALDAFNSNNHSYDNTGTGFSANTVKGVLDEIGRGVTITPTGETNASLNLKSQGTGTVQANGKKVATVSSEVSATLTAAGWTGAIAPYSITVAVAGVLAGNLTNQDMFLAPAITAAAYDAFGNGKIIGYTQDAGTVTLRALGTKPAVDIPVIFSVRGDK